MEKRMPLELNSEEETILKKVITDYLNRLRDEIYKKHALAPNQALKREEVLLSDLLKKV